MSAYDDYLDRYGVPTFTYLYDVLDDNGDVLASFDNWSLAATFLADWQTGTATGSIREN